VFLSDLSIKQPVFATMLAVSLVALGTYSYRELSVDLFPDVEIPVLTVQTVYPGSSPQTVEREVTKRIEEALNTIPGLRHIQSTSTEGMSIVIAEFHLATNIHTAQQDAQAKINSIRADFPQDMEEPVIQRIDFNAMPILSLALDSPRSDIKQLSLLAEKVIKKQLEPVAGVGQINLVGLARREIQVLVDTEKLRSLGITFAQVSNALRGENLDVPAGKLEQGAHEPLVRISGKYKSVEHFNTLIVATREGRPIYLPEVASIVDGVEERRSAAILDDAPALALEVIKQSGANTIEVADGVYKAVERLNQELPEHIRLRAVVDTSTFIRESVEDVRTTLLIGGFLTVLIVFFFLNSWRSTVITGLALPVSVISTFIVMNALDFTLNVLTLMGLSLAIGLLIDDAIVVRENIVRHMHMGADHYSAAREATSEIGLAVMATTFTILAVFVPVAFMGGIMGRFFYQFGITVGFAVIVSLYVSFTIDPMLSSRWYDPAADPSVPRSWFGRKLQFFNDQLDRLRNVLAVALGWSLGHRLAVLAIGILSVLASVGIFGRVGSAFMPEADEGQFRISYKADPSVSIDRSTAIARELGQEMRSNPAVAYTYATIGGVGKPTNEGSIFVKLKERATRPHQLSVMGAAREQMKRFRAIRIAVTLADDNTGETKPIQISVRGADLTRLKALSETVEDRLRATPGATDIDTSEDQPRPEMRIAVDRKAAGDLGLDLGSIATTVRGLVAGEVVSKFEDEDGDSYDVRLRTQPSERVYASNLLSLDLPGHRGTALVPLSQVARIEPGAAPSKIRRFDLVREIRVSAIPQNRSLGEVVNEVQQRLQGVPMLPGYTIRFTGDFELMMESFGYALNALLLGVILIYSVLASQFRSFLQPLAIMLSLPLSLLGVAAMLYAVGDTLNMMSIIGIILLMGLVTKNAILLVDFTNVQRRDGKPRTEAIIEAARTRLRPVLMTTLAMIFGMLPLAFEWGAGAEFRAPMARAVVGGLITSTLLTLIVVPVVYTYLDDFGSWRLSPGGRRTPGRVKTPSAVEHAHGSVGD
jgi:HAE1 family hydrophobic/amphiphilic exporter-1